jgi:Flp pilus assembly protein TadG
MLLNFGKTVTVRLRRLVPHRARKLAAEQDGAAAVEFALVAAPFLAMVFAIIETALVFFASQALETAAADSARLVMTGQSQSWDEVKFKEEVCKKVYGLFDCSNKMYVDVRKFDTFGDISVSNPVDGEGNLTTDFKYEKSGPGSIVVVRLIYPWQVFVSLLGFNLADMAGNKRLLVATVAFKNEPF